MAIDYIDSSAITSGNYNSTAIDVPTGADADSWLIVSWFAANAPAGVNTPSGFTLLRSGTISGNEKAVTLVGQTSGATITLALADDSTGWMAARCSAWSGADGVDVSDFAETTTAGTNSPAVSVTTTQANTKLVLVGVNDGSASPTAPTGWTRRTTGDNIIISDLDQAAAGASGDVTQTWPNSGDIGIGLIALKPAAAADTPPTADAGPDQADVEPFATVTLDGTGSTDSDGTVASYAWTQTAGTTVALSDATAAQPTFTAPGTLGGDTLTFSLVVTDDAGTASDPDTVDITVLTATMFTLAGDTPAAMQMVPVISLE